MERGRRSATHRVKRLSAAGRKLLPASMEGRWHPEEVWRLAYLVESSWHSSQFSDTPEWWVRLTPYFPGSTIHDLRRLHVFMIKSQMNATGWTPQEIQKLVAAVCSNMRPGTVDTPEWWALVAAHLPPGRTALDARLTYNSLFYSHNRASPLPNWTLDDYVLLMKVLTRNLAVDVADAAAMERIAALLPGKTGAEVRHLIVHWRPHLLAALAKADRVVAAQGSSSSSSSAGPSGRR